MVIELQRGKVNTWSIIRNVAHAVDALLSQQPYDVERRTRLGDTSGGGKVRVQYTHDKLYGINFEHSVDSTEAMCAIFRWSTCNLTKLGSDVP